MPIQPSKICFCAFLQPDFMKRRGPFKVSRSFAGLRPLSERPLKPSPQLVCLTLRKLPEVLFKLSLHLVPGAHDLKAYSWKLRHLKSSDCSIRFSSSLDSPFQADHGGTAYKMPGENEQAVHEPGRSRFLQTMKDRLLENGVQKA